MVGRIGLSREWVGEKEERTAVADDGVVFGDGGFGLDDPVAPVDDALSNCGVLEWDLGCDHRRAGRRMFEILFRLKWTCGCRLRGEEMLGNGTNGNGPAPGLGGMIKESGTRKSVGEVLLV